MNIMSYINMEALLNMNNLHLNEEEDEAVKENILKSVTDLATVGQFHMFQAVNDFTCLELVDKVSTFPLSLLAEFGYVPVKNGLRMKQLRAHISLLTVKEQRLPKMRFAIRERIKAEWQRRWIKFEILGVRYVSNCARVERMMKKLCVLDVRSEEVEEFRPALGFPPKNEDIPLHMTVAELYIS